MVLQYIFLNISISEIYSEYIVYGAELLNGHIFANCFWK